MYFSLMGAKQGLNFAKMHSQYSCGVSLLQWLEPMHYHACRRHWKYKVYFASVEIDMVHAESALETTQGSTEVEDQYCYC